jgi:alginate O-acetyltransferase complex protein AlgJ
MSKTTLPAPAPVSRSVYAILCALTFAAVVLTGGWQMALGALEPEGLKYSHDVQDFREGRTTGALEKQLEQGMPVRPQLIGFANTLRYVLTRGAGDQVRLGRDDWLFLTDELRYEAQGEHNLQDHAVLLADVAQKLARQGVALVVALVPDKARVYPQQLLNREYPPYQASRYQDMLAALRLRNVVVVDLLTPLQGAAQSQNVYYQSDTHWNQTGAEVAANAVALAINHMGLKLEESTYATTEAQAPTERSGDLIRLMGVDMAPAMLRPGSDHEAVAVTRQTSADAPAGLFGDVQVPVVLTGTSYSLRGNFHGYLQQALSSKILNTAKDGGGFITAAEAYFKDDAFLTAKPTVLVWEVPERFVHTKLPNARDWSKRVGL